VKLNPLIYVAIVGTGLVLAVGVFVSRGGEQVSVGAVPVAASSPPAAPEISEPPLVAVPALPARSQHTSKPPAATPTPTPTPRVPRPPRQTPAPPPPPPPAAPTRKRKAAPQRGRLKQAPLKPPLTAPPR
jgi:hypothetical protein